MLVYVYKPYKYNPIIILLSMVSCEEEFNYLEDSTDELFGYLFNNNYADTTNIILLSVIKQYDKTTSSLIIPSIHTNQDVINYCDHVQFTNNIIVDTIKNSDSIFYHDIDMATNKMKIYDKSTNLSHLASYYRI
jgi:hypothetical protein